jgi:hypothetical protein
MESLDSINDTIESLTSDMLKHNTKNEDKIIELLELRKFIIERDEKFILLNSSNEETERINYMIDLFLAIIVSDRVIQNNTIIELNTFGIIFDRMHDAIKLLPKSIIAYRDIKRDKPRTMATYLNKLLIHIGAKVVPVYKNKTAETRGRPESYLLEWICPVESY